MANRGQTKGKQEGEKAGGGGGGGGGLKRGLLSDPGGSN